MKIISALLLASVASAAAAPAPDTVSLTNPIKGGGTIEFVAASGKAVQPGEALVVLDTGSTLVKLQEAEEARRAAEADIKVNQDKIAPLEAVNAAAVASATYDATQAERAFKRYKEGEAPAGELALKLILVEAQSAFERQQERFNARDKLLADGYIQKIEYDKEAVLLTKAQYALEAAKLKLDAFVKYEKDQMTEQLARVLDTKKLALAAALASGPKSIEAARAAVETSKQKLATLTAECERWKQVLKSTVIYAPVAGQFFAGDPAHSEIKLEPGAAVRSGAVLGVIKKTPEKKP